MRRVQEYENAAHELNTALCLLSLAMEEIDEAPDVTSQEDVWRFVAYCGRSSVVDALVHTVFKIVNQQKELIEGWVVEDIKKRKKNEVKNL